ncbi:hypothetical protein L2E82_38228 [Cichorium intybus]|uniref:Uncharacterized protein n=1 Tax=Cichorium intybus TaxID=13427 RepID=A0ACB9AF53_CICIN|nr:hypothetical protein L2E82_38228 [Cichorium intybus]
MKTLPSLGSEFFALDVPSFLVVPRSERQRLLEDMTLIELHGLLKFVKASLKQHRSSSSTAPVLAIHRGDVVKNKISHPKGKGRAKVGQSNQGFKRKADSDIAATSGPNKAICFYCQLKGHWKCSCPTYLKDLKKVEVK